MNQLFSEENINTRPVTPNVIDDLKLLAKTSRPVVWTWFSGPFIIGFFVAGSNIYNSLAWIEFLALGPLYCLVVYGVNDIYDYESDKKNERKGEGKTQGDILEPEKHDLVMKGSIIASIMLIALSLSTKNLVNILGMAFMILWAFTYSAPPLRLKERPIIDSLSNGLGYAIVPIAIGFSFGAPITKIPESVFWAGFTVASMHTAFAVMDYRPDKKAGVNTIAVRFGQKKTILFPVLATLLTLLFSPMKGFIPQTLLFGLFTLVSLMALDIYGYIEFKKKYRDRALGIIYLTGIVLTTIFLLKSRQLI